MKERIRIFIYNLLLPRHFCLTKRCKITGRMTGYWHREGWNLNGTVNGYTIPEAIEVMKALQLDEADLIKVEKINHIK